MKKFLIIFLILILSLPFLVSFLYSVSVLCEMSGCDICGMVGHHVEKWLDSFIVVAIIEIGLILSILIIVCLNHRFQREFQKLRLYIKYKLFNSANSLLLNPIKRLYAKAIIDPQIYS